MRLSFPASLLLVGAVLGQRAQAQVIDYTAVRQYVGDDVTVQGPVARVERVRGGGVKFSIGKTYSRRTLDVYVPANLINALEPELHSYEGKQVEVRGRILTGEAEGLRGRTEGSSTVPAIVLVDLSRFKVLGSAGEKKPE